MLSSKQSRRRTQLFAEGIHSDLDVRRRQAGERHWKREHIPPDTVSAVVRMAAGKDVQKRSVLLEESPDVHLAL